MSDQPPGLRISDADRERAATLLHKAMGEGRITLTELEERLDVVYAAKYEADLRPPLADLPGGDVAIRSAAAAPGAALAQPDPSVPPVVLRAGMSTIKRSGAWDVPPRIRVQSTMGSVVLDFCDTPIPHAVVDIEIDLGAGSAKLLVPDESTANVDGVAAGMGTVKSNVPSVQRVGVPHFVVHGHAGMGSVTVRRRFRLGGHKF
ncbi:DUF1707 domain-containing protein [Actinomycetes bacterium KLBMP 9759]